jgi:hypothetical protein
VAWLQAQWGSALGTVVEHIDEKYPHVHFWVVPDITAGSRLLISSVHPGYGAATAAAEAGETRKQQQNAYDALAVGKGRQVSEIDLHFAEQAGLVRRRNHKVAKRSQRI